VTGEPRSVDAARRTAYDALRRVETEDAYLNLVLPALLDQHAVPARDAALVTELAYGTSRRLGSYDAVLDACVRGGVGVLQPSVHTALLLGCHQLLALRVPAHAAVSTTVDLVRTVAGERPVRLANAVLRAVSRRDLDSWMAIVAPGFDIDPIGHLSVVHAHPRWIVEAYRDVLQDLDEVAGLLAANNTPPCVTLAVRPGLAEVDDLARYPGEPGRWSPYAWRLASGNPASIPLVAEGRAGVQDEGSQLTALTLAVAAPESPGWWLDLCAGPGGKAALLSGLATEHGGRLVAVEPQRHRARLVVDSLRAYEVPAQVVIADGTVPPWPPASFDAVLADVPCTGLGALRRRPESRWRRRPGDLDTLVPLQRRLLISALDAARKGGVVVYATCSPHDAETRAVVDAVLSERSDVTEEDARITLRRAVPRAAGADLGPGPHIQLWPHRHETDAMFIALLRRGT
jgi:16S rRNA (cytosine967-C5)-methyltransferase